MKKGVHAMLKNALPYILVSVLLAPAASHAQVMQVKYLSYDIWGNPTEVQDAMGVKTAYDWSVDGTKIVGIFTNAQASDVFAHSFAYDGFDGLPNPVDVSNGVTTTWSIFDGKLKMHHPGTVGSNWSADYLKLSLPVEYSGRTIIEMDVTAGPSSDYSLTVGAGGSSYPGGNGGSENLVWSAFRYGSWSHYNGSWTTIMTGFIEGEVYNLKIVADPITDKVDYYVDGELVLPGITGRSATSGIQSIGIGNYGRSSTAVDWFIDNVRIYPEAAQAVSQEADPLFGNPLAMKDVAGSTNRFEYDNFGRLEKTYNANGELVSSQVYYYSLDGNASFNPADPNRVESWAHYDPATPSNATKSVSYLDGLGREIQTQQRGGSSTLITGTLYNERGLPEVSSRPIEKANQTTYLSTLFDGSGTFTPGGALPGSSPIEDYYQESYAYSQSAYEDSPLGRVLKSTLPGAAHNMGSGKEIQTIYGLNTDTTETFTSNGYTWPRNRLQKTITEDPDGNQTITYTDGWGRTIASGVDMDGNGKLDGKNKETCSGNNCDLITEFSYDKLGNLVLVEDPEELDTSTSYDYTISDYNPLGQLVEKRLPDQSHPHSYRYDKKGRLRFHRDPIQDAASDHYYYTKYDELDRPIEMGSYNSASYFDNTVNINTPGWPSSGHTELVYHHYDGDSTYTGARNLKGRLTRTSYKDQASGSWGSTSYSYNELGLVEWVVQRLPGLSGDHKIEYSYDALGRTTRVFYNPSGTGNDHYIWYYYDELGRLDEVASHTTSSEGSAQTEAVYTYRADGQVEEVNLGSSAQSVDYSYTVQGWLSSINNPDNFTEPTAGYANDRFGMALRYYNGFTGGVTPTARYNGNIAQVEWEQQMAGTGSNEPFYSFTYDNANRLAMANFHDPVSDHDDNNGLDVVYSYDKNGNITAIDRKNAYDGSVSNYMSPTSISISGTSNRVTGITYKDGSSTTSEALGYDASGNVTSNTIPGMTAASYDWRNLPYQVSTGSGTMYYGYDAGGQRVRKEVNGGTEMHYVRGAGGETVAVYKDGSREFVNLLAGSEIIGTWDGTERRYFLKDHLGSVRTTVDASGNVDGYDDYYAFGLQMPGRSSNTGNPNDNYKFTGHERDDEAGLNIDYMGARYYDPLINRFLSIDPYASKYPSLSPYSYVANNPVNAFDPDGRLIVFINGMHGGSGAWPRSDRYWSNSGYFAHAVMDHFNDYNAVFVDGSVGGIRNTATYASLQGRAGTGNLSAAYRYEAGYSRGRRDAAKLIGLLAPEETLKIITHSMGQVYGKGYVKAIMEYIRNSKDPKVRKTLVSLVADFDPFQAASSFGAAHSDIYTQQFWHDGGLFGIADQVQDGVDENNEDKEKKRHGLNTFLNDIQNLREGTYEWDEKKEQWICTSCQD